MKFKTPPANLKLKFLKIDAIRVNVAKQYLSDKRYNELLNKAITERRVIINA
jgi:hypothetical protein